MASTVEDKIRKLLAIAQCEGASEAERALALEKAAAIAEQHAIDMNELGSEPADFGVSPVWDGSAFPNWVMPVAVVVELFNVRVMFRDRRQIELFGSRSARQVGDYVFTFLRREFLRCVKDYEKALRGHLTSRLGVVKASRWAGLSVKQRGEYFRGLSAGLYQKIMQGRKARGTEAGLVRVNAELQKAFEKTFGNVPEKKTRADEINAHGF